MTKNNEPEHGSLVSRSSIDSRFQWNINDIYPDQESWKTASQQFKKDVDAFSQYKGQLHDCQTLKTVLREQEKLSIIISKLYAYARLQQDTDNANQQFQALVGEAEALAAAFSNAVSFVEPELLSLSQEKLNDLLSDSNFSDYRFYLNNLLRLSKHVLPKEQEELLSLSQLATSGPAAIFRSLVSADMQFPLVKNSEGLDVTVSEGNYLLNMTSNDRLLRRNSFKGLMTTYHKYRNTLANTLSSNCRVSAFYATAHKYHDTLEACLSEDNIPPSLYDGLIETVHENLKPLHEYIALKKEILGLDEFHAYDIYQPISNAADSFACDFDEAKVKVTAALSPLGYDYQAALQEGFDKQWIDIYENKGKRSGAYSWGVYGCHPYVLLNFHGTLNDVFTLAHEMGHSIHTWYSNKNQSYTYSGYKIFVAEVASTCNEALLIRHLLKNSKDKQEKAYLLNYFLESFRGTLFRQTMFAEFEQKAHEMAAAGESMTSQSLCNIYKKLNEDYFGPDTVIDPEIQYEWERIPHFYTPFYVYQYATGFSAAIAISRKIFNGEPGILEGYKKFLSGGCSDTPIELLKLAGVDMSHTGPVEEALKFFEELLNEFEELA